MSAAIPDLNSLPGHEIVVPGLADLLADRETIDSAAVLVARRRLIAAGLDVPDRRGDGEPGHRLFELLIEAGVADPHSRYNAILRRIDSCARVLESARAR